MNESWPILPSDLTLTPSHVHIIFSFLDFRPEALAACSSLLSADELQRVEKLRIQEKRSEFIAARGFLRRVLGDILRCAPQQITFGRHAHGKPFVMGSIVLPLRFNLSHTSGAAILAVSSDRELGIDMEVLRDVPDCETIAKQFFTADECDSFLQIPPPDRSAAFLRLWTKKEALLKGIGTGFAKNERSLHIPGSATVVQTNWKLQDVPLEALPSFSRYVASMAIEGLTASPLRCWLFGVRPE